MAMIKSELELIRDLLTIWSDAKLHKSFGQAVFIIDREIKLASMNPVKDNNAPRPEKINLP